MYTRIALRALEVSYRDVGEGGVAMNCEKNTIFPEHPVPKAKVIISSIHFRQSKGPQELDLALNDHVKQRKQITYFHMMGTSIMDLYPLIRSPTRI